jgi:ABC-type Fe3+-hydroxamate transport system substrate-binding protein
VSVRLYPVSVRDADGRLVVLKKKPETIAVAGSAAVELASSLALQVTRVGTGSGDLNLELIRAIRPQLIIASSEIDQLAINHARALGVAVYVARDRTLDGIEQALSDASLLAGVPVKGRMERKRMAKGRAEVRTAIVAANPVRVFVDLGDFTTASDSSFIGDLIREAGGINVAGPDVQEGPFPLKRLRRLRPEIIVVGTDSRLTLTKLRRNPATRWLPAVRTGRLVRVNLQLLGPGPDVVSGLRDLAAAFYPNAFR